MRVVSLTLKKLIFFVCYYVFLFQNLTVKFIIRNKYALTINLVIAKVTGVLSFLKSAFTGGPSPRTAKGRKEIATELALHILEFAVDTAIGEITDPE